MEDHPIVSHGGPIGIFRFLPTTNVGGKGKQSASQSLHTLMRVYLQAQTALHLHVMNNGYFDCGIKPECPNWSLMLE